MRQISSTNNCESHSLSVPQDLRATVTGRNLEEMPVIIFRWHDQTPAFFNTVQNVIGANANGVLALPAYLRTPQHPPTSMANLQLAILHHVRLPNVTLHRDYALMCPDVGTFAEVSMNLRDLMWDKFMTNTLAPMALPGALPLARVSTTRTVHTVQDLSFRVVPGTVGLWGWRQDKSCRPDWRGEKDGRAASESSFVLSG